MIIHVRPRRLVDVLKECVDLLEEEHSSLSYHTRDCVRKEHVESVNKILAFSAFLSLDWKDEPLPLSYSRLVSLVPVHILAKIHKKSLLPVDTTVSVTIEKVTPRDYL